MLEHLGFGVGCALLALYGPLSEHVTSRAAVALAFVTGTLISHIVSGVYFSIYHGRKARQLGCEPPKQRQWRIPGGLDMIQRMIKADQKDEVPEEFYRISQEMGVNTFCQSFFGKPQLMTTEPNNIKAILATQFNDFQIGELRRNNFFPLLGNGIFTSDGKFWEHSRAMLRPQFARQQVADLELEEYHVQTMFQHLPVDASGWTQRTNLGPLFFRLTLDSATEFLFGQSVHSQVAALPAGHKEKANFEKIGDLNWENMARCFDSATHHLGARGRYGELYWLHSPKAFYDDCKEVHKFVDYYVDLALKTQSKDAAAEEKQIESPNGPTRYVFLHELAKATQDPIELRSQLLNILLAGRDTTAGLLGWTFWLMARQPQIYHKLRNIILEEFGTYDNPQNISFATLKSCSYLQYAMNEALRLYPSVPLNARRAVKDTTIPTGGGPLGNKPVYVRKGIEVVYCVHNMHRRKDLWGEDALEFRPERWIGRKAGWEFLPFNGGPRICLGQQFALTEAGYVIVRMLQRFDQVENLDEYTPVPKHQYSVTTAPKEVNLRFHQAQN